LPDFASLAALRAWHEGFTARAAVTRYLAHVRNDGQSSRGVIARIRRQLVACATARQRDDLIPLFTGPGVTVRPRPYRRLMKAKPCFREAQM
jgi:hypothetical protein